MLRTAQAQSEEEQLRNALEASCNTAAAAAAEADMLRQAIAESMASTAAGEEAEAESAAATTTAAPAAGEAGATAGPVSPPAGAQVHQAHGVPAEDEEEELRRALLLSGMGEDWEILPSGADGGQGFDLDELQEDPELRLAIKASLAGE